MRAIKLMTLLGGGALLFGNEGGSIQKSFMELMPIDRFAAEVDLDELSNIVVTDTKQKGSKHEATQKIEVITDMEFEGQGYARNIASLLSNRSGQFVNILSRNDANWGSYAGLGAKYNTYMVDGLGVDSFVDSMSLDPWAFERIEAYRGPASVLYSNYLTMDFAGNEAPLAGTTNFILKERIDTMMSRAQIGVGSYNTKNIKLYHQNKAANLSYFVGGSAEGSDYLQYGSDGSWLQTTEKPDYNRGKLYGKITKTLGEAGHKISIFGHTDKHSGDMGRANRGFGHAYTLINGAYENRLSEALALSLKVGYRDYKREFENDNYPANISLNSVSATKQQIMMADATLNYAHGEGFMLTFGSDAQWAKYETSSLINGATRSENDVKASSVSYFLQEKAAIGKWVLRGGVRQNKIEHEYKLLGGNTPSEKSASWSKTLWSVGARYTPNDELSFYTNAGSSFMAPSAKQVGGTVSAPTDSGQLANPSLKPESGLGIDAGFELLPTKRLSIGARLFYNEVTDAIVESVVSVAPSRTKASNAGSVKAKGVELDIKNRLENGSDMFANVTYTDSKVSNPIAADEDGTHTPFVPNIVANAGITAPLWLGVSGTASLQYVGEYFDSTSKSGRSAFGSYATANLKLQKNIAREKGYSVNGYLELNNITNQKVKLPWDFKDTGFNWYAAVGVVF